VRGGKIENRRSVRGGTHAVSALSDKEQITSKRRGNTAGKGGERKGLREARKKDVSSVGMKS